MKQITVLIIVTFLTFRFCYSQNQISIGLLTTKTFQDDQKEVVAAFDFLEGQDQYNPTKIYIEDVSTIDSIENFDIIWFHHNDPSYSIQNSETLDLLNQYLQECSMYFNDWTKASVTLTDGKYLSDRLVRYNIYNQQMEFVHEGDTAAFGDPEEISTVVLNGHEFIYRDFEYEDEVKKGYFEVLVNGDCQLLLHRCIAFRLIEDCSDPNTNFVKEHYYLSQKYFISENCKTAIFLPNKKKEIIVMFENSDKDIKSFIKENKIKICKEEDLKDLISYYNSD